MDHATVQSYDVHGERYARKWLTQTMPAETQRAVEQAFQRGLASVDVGCGSGRDVAWLVAAGYPTVGLEASSTMLRVARAAFPDLVFEEDALPALANTQARFAQVLCRNVLMHLPPAAHGAAVRRLLGLLRPGGVLVLTWRTDTDSGVARDGDGRLYSHVAPELVASAVAESGGRVRAREAVSSGASGKTLALWIVDGA